MDIKNQPFFVGKGNYKESNNLLIFNMLDQFIGRTIDKQCKVTQFDWDHILDPDDSELPSRAACIIRHPKAKRTVQITIYPRLIQEKQREEILMQVHHKGNDPLTHPEFEEFKLIDFYDQKAAESFKIMISSMLINGWDYELKESNVLRKRPAPAYLSPNFENQVTKKQVTKKPTAKKAPQKKQNKALLEWFAQQRKEQEQQQNQNEQPTEA